MLTVLGPSYLYSNLQFSICEIIYVVMWDTAETKLQSLGKKELNVVTGRSSQRTMWSLDLSKESNGLKIYIPRNTGLLYNTTDKRAVILWHAFFFLGKAWVYKQSQVYFTYFIYRDGGLGRFQHEKMSKGGERLFLFQQKQNVKIIVPFITLNPLV